MFTFMHFDINPLECNIEIDIAKEKVFSPNKQTK